jgi:hypothetical protein
MNKLSILDKKTGKQTLQCFTYQDYLFYIKHKAVVGCRPFFFYKIGIVVSIFTGFPLEMNIILNMQAFTLFERFKNMLPLLAQQTDAILTETHQP